MIYAGCECWYRSDGSRGVASCQQFGLRFAGVPTPGASSPGAWEVGVSAAREIDLLLLLQELCCYFPSRVLHLVHRLLRCVVVLVTTLPCCCCCCYRRFSVVVVVIRLSVVVVVGGVTEASLLLLLLRFSVVVGAQAWHVL